jgi:hypothetical protein
MWVMREIGDEGIWTEIFSKRSSGVRLLNIKITENVKKR